MTEDSKYTWDEYFASLPEADRKSCNGSCDCTSCRAIRDFYYYLRDTIEVVSEEKEQANGLDNRVSYN